MAVAPSLTRRVAWPLAAALAFAFLVLLALHGERPDAGLRSFVSAGLMTSFASQDARAVEITRDRESWRFERDGQAWRTIEAPSPVPADVGARIDAGLKLLRDSAPLRILSPEEMRAAPPTDFGLSPPALQVKVRGPGDATFTVRFGARNPLGVACYTRVDGVEGVPLLATYVMEAWQQVIGTPTQ
jgi:hypothetical protein